METHLNQLNAANICSTSTHLSTRKLPKHQQINLLTFHAQPVEVRASSRRAKATTGTENAIGKLAAARQKRQQRVQQKEQEKEQQEEEEREAGGVWDEEQELSSDEAPLEEEGDEEEEGAYRETRGGYRTERYDDASDEVGDRHVFMVLVAVLCQKGWQCLVTCGAGRCV